mmetsp:Transcript_21173/g.44996  ORF Transcript_21173/g.44996 Transcript_21173/m.44996 type:complete len:83 (-) Transcript_21173:330-578(-)
MSLRMYQTHLSASIWKLRVRQAKLSMMPAPSTQCRWVGALARVQALTPRREGDNEGGATNSAWTRHNFQMIRDCYSKKEGIS